MSMVQATTTGGSTAWNASINHKCAPRDPTAEAHLKGRLQMDTAGVLSQIGATKMKLILRVGHKWTPQEYFCK